MKNDYVETYTYNCAIRALMAQDGFVFRSDFESEEQRSAYQKEYDQQYSDGGQWAGGIYRAE